MRLTNSLLIGLASLGLGCAGADDPAATGVDSSSSSSGHVDPSTTSDDTDPQPTTVSTTDSDPTDDPSSSEDDSSSGTTGLDDSSSSGATCATGSLGCPCDVGVCESDLVCVDDVCEALENCAVDGYEPNDSEDAATPLETLGDSDDPGSIVGTLDHADDVEWFTYFGEDNFGLPPGVAPARDLSASGGLRLCKFLECPDGIEVTEVTCPNGSDLAQSPAGRPGCCSSGSIMMPDFNCTGGTDDSAQVYIRLDNAEDQCVDWSVGYEF
jgi:hypothetical protein